MSVLTIYFDWRPQRRREKGQGRKPFEFLAGCVFIVDRSTAHVSVSVSLAPISRPRDQEAENCSIAIAFEACIALATGLNTVLE